MIEEWRDVVGFDGPYKVSNTGKVARYVDGQLKELSPKSIRGYPAVCLKRSGVKKYPYVHTLVLEAFVGPRPTGFVCCHYDGVKTNNRIENLRWGTYKQNAEDAARLGSYNPPLGSENKRSKLTETDIPVIRRRIQDGETNVDIAKDFRVDPSIISEIRSNKLWKHVPCT